MKKFLKDKTTQASLIFLILMGVISMMSDMTHEGAKSVYGSFLTLAGAPAYVVSFISGLGECLGCSLIILTGYIANKSKKYWTMTIIGYMINLLAIPALALTFKDGYILACALIVFERIGKAIRKPAKSTLVSFSSQNLGAGKSFAFVEFLDQIGAFLGPIIFTVVLSINISTDLFTSYRFGFLFLLIPAVITLIILFIAKHFYPHPEDLEEDKEIVKPSSNEKPKIKFDNKFIFYLIAIALCGFAFIDFPLITLHVNTLNIFEDKYVPLLYSLAMLIDAFAALLFGNLFDKFGIKVLAVSTLLSLASPLFIFLPFDNKQVFIYIGVILWGIGMGSQESILKSAVYALVEKENRSFGFGIFEGIFGLSWFIGSLILGFVYESSKLALVIVSMAMQVLAIPLFLISSKKNKQIENKEQNIG